MVIMRYQGVVHISEKKPEQQKSPWGRREELLNKSDELTLKADLLAFESKYEEAVEYYNKALEINPKNPHLWAFKGITLKGGLNREEEALQCWEQAKKLDPDLAKAISYSERKDEDDDLKDPVICGMSETKRQKILKLMREQANQDPR
jgi:tetratricopeptide (TPR) repeat protein